MEHNHSGHNHSNGSTISKLKGKAGAFEAWLLPIFAKAPHLPQNWKKFIVMVAPWLALIFGILGLIGLLGSGMFAILLSPLLALQKGLRADVLFIIILLDFISLILALLAFSPLSEMKKVGWDYVFYAFLVSALSTILSVLTKFGGFGDVVVILVGAYLIFEVHGRYN